MKAGASARARPIIFSGESVRAILDGRKTQTRRVVNPQPSEGWQPHSYGDVHKMLDGEFVWRNEEPVVVGWGPSSEDGMEAHPCPFGRPGDRLWVREPHWRYTGIPIDGHGPSDFVQAPDSNPYAARCYDDNPELPLRDAACVVVRLSPIHMPRWASRITLEVTGVRVERLHALTEADAKAEGVAPAETTDGDLSHALGYIDTWDALNAKRGHGWDANPWVWVVEFKKVEEA